MTTVDEARAALLTAVRNLGNLTPEDWDERRGGDPIARTINAVFDIIEEQWPALIAAVRAEYEDVERLARAIRTAELKSQIDAEKHGAKPAELGPMPDWYRAYAADVWTAWREAGR